MLNHNLRSETTDEYYNFRDEMSKNTESLFEIQKYDGPKWSKI